MSASPAPVVLASSSVYRRRLLARLITDFECLSPQIDESRLDNETPAALAARLAQTKALTCAAQRPGAVVLGSDQVPALDDEILHKPGSHERAIRQLERCSGQAVIFYTAVAILGPQTGTCDCHVDETTVRFRDLDPADIEHYLQVDKPYDCAGSFKVE